MDQTNDTNKNINDISNSDNKNSENFIGINMEYWKSLHKSI